MAGGGLVRLARLVHAGAFNLGLWMRAIFGVGTPRSLQGRLTTLGVVLNTLWIFTYDAITGIWAHHATQQDHLQRATGFVAGTRSLEKRELYHGLLGRS